MRERPNHHGDLRQALIDAALELIEKRGVAALTLRAVLLVDGQAAGASPPTLIDVALRSLYLGLAPRAPARRLRSV